MLRNLKIIYDYIDQHFDEHVENVRRLVRQPSISFTNEGVEKCADILVQMIKDIGGQRAERCDFKDGYPVVYGEILSKNPNAKTIIAYTLYDVMPVDEEGWRVPPFSAEIIEGTEIGLPEDYGKVVVGRGARNQKGPIVAFMNAVKSMLEVKGDVPVNILFAFDGEEECMSPHFPEFIKRYEKELSRANAAYYCNPATDEQNVHNIYLGFRGIIPLELEVKGGDWGGPARGPLFPAEDALLDAPAWRLIWALASLKSPDGRIVVDGFFDDLRPPDREEQELIDEVKTKMDSDTLKKRLGVRRWKRSKPLEELLDDYLWGPVINIDGLVGGYIGPRVKTTFPHKATAKLDIRLFPNMDRDDIIEKLRKHFEKHGFPEVEVRPSTMGNQRCGYNASRSPKDEPIVQSAIRAAESFGYRSVTWPIYFGSTPLGMFSEAPLNLPIVSAGLGRMGNDHRENEYFTVEGIRIYEKFVVTFLHEYAQT
jgi:acetylornithine deacetylase/succinyl-diaminopimelate desuccinylase-like protein